MSDFTNEEITRRIAEARTIDAAPEPLPYTSMGALLADQAARRGAQPFLIFRDESGTRQEWSWSAFAQAVRTVAGLLATLGLHPGDRIATLTGNSPETVLLYFAAWWAGMTVVPINTGEDDDRLAFVLDNAGVKVAFGRAAQLARIRSGPRTVAVEGDWLGDAPPADAAVTDAATEALIVYTSGTTGPPKGVVLEHGNLLEDARRIAAWHGLTDTDRAMLVLPIHHVNGTVVTLATPALVGGSVVLNAKFSASRFWKIAAEERCTWSSVVPTVLAFLCEKGEDLAQHDLSAFRHFICGAGPLTCDLARRFHETFGVRVVHGYGLSETTCYSCFLPADLAPDDYAHWMWGCGFPSIGIPLPGNDMAIHDEGGAALGPETRGEIVIRGPVVMRGYWQRSDANAAAFAHGWFRSGDEGFWRAGDDGARYFFITGRLKELFIRGGVNYSPLEIDEVLAQIPGVKAAMAVGFENDFYGEEIGAYVQREAGAELNEPDILAFCAERLPYAKRPKVVVFGDDFPVTSTGKYQRNRLKDRFTEWKGVEFRAPKEKT